MRPGVPWNVKGIEAEAREVAQLAARRAGVSLGEWLTGLIMHDGRGGAQSHSSTYQQQYQPGDGTYGPQPMPQYSPAPAPNLRYPQVVPQPHAQAYPQQHLPPQGFLSPSAQAQAFQQTTAGFDPQVRGEYAAVAHGLRDLAERLDQTERRAQQAISTVNQSVAAMQDRIDAAERVKQLADAAFSSAADALAQSAREQSKAFDTLETTVRSVQRRISDIETGQAEWPGKEAISRLDTALGQLQKRLSEMEASRSDLPTRDTINKLEATLAQLQKRLADMETASTEAPGREQLARLEASIASMRNEAGEADRRTRDDITQMAKFLRDLGSRVDNVERGSSLSESVSARFDALEARSASMFDEIRGQMSAMDGRIAQVNSGKNSITLAAFSALKGSVEGIAARLDSMSEADHRPLHGSIDAIEAKLGTLASKLEQSERRSSESVASVSTALKAITSRIEESDQRQAQTMQVLTRRLDESNQRADENARELHRSLGEFTERLDTSEQRHKDAIAGLRMTVDGFVAKGVADALPAESNYSISASSAPSALSSLQSYSPPPFKEPELPPFATTSARMLSSEPPPPPPPPLSFDDDELPPKADDGYSVSALRTIMAGPLSAERGDHPDNFDPRKFDDEDAVDQRDTHVSLRRSDDFLAQARRAAQASTGTDSLQDGAKRGAFAGVEAVGGRRLGRLAVMAVAGVAVVAGIVAVLFTLPGSSSSNDAANRPGPGATIGDILNGPSEPAVSPASPDDKSSVAPSADFAPLPAPDDAALATGQPRQLGTPTETPPAPPTFTSGTSALPGPDPEIQIAGLEAAAMRGDARSQFILSLRYSEGRGVEKDEARAASLVTKAAEHGLAIAQYRLGALFERGVGVSKDLAQAKSWYEKAAKAGNRKAMHNLAVLYADGTGGSDALKQAAKWFREGASYGLTDSQYNLAVLLERGMGVEKNLKEAAVWYAIAAGQGDTGAAERLEAAKKLLSPGDIAQALEAARKYKAKTADPAANELPGSSG